MRRTRSAQAAAGLLVLASLVAGCSTGKADANLAASPTPVAADLCATLATNVALYGQVAAGVAQAEAGQTDTPDIDFKAAEALFTELEKSAAESGDVQHSLVSLGKEFNAGNDRRLAWPSELSTGGGRAYDWAVVDEYLRAKCDVPPVAAATPTPTSTEGVAPTQTGTTATISYTDADSYQYEADVTFPSVTASSDISKSKPGETEISASIPIDYKILNMTAGRDAPMPQLHMDFLWPIDSAFCQSWNLLKTATLAGKVYCTLGIYAAPAPPQAPSIPAGGKFEVGPYAPNSDATSMGARSKYKWTVAEAAQAAVLQDLHSPYAAVISGATPQVPGSECAYFGTDGTTGSTQYHPIWSSIEIGCGTKVG